MENEPDQTTLSDKCLATTLSVAQMVQQTIKENGIDPIHFELLFKAAMGDRGVFIPFDDIRKLLLVEAKQHRMWTWPG